MESLPGGVGNKVREIDPRVRRVFSDGRGRGVSCGVNRAQFNEAIVALMGCVLSEGGCSAAGGLSAAQAFNVYFWHAAGTVSSIFLSAARTRYRHSILLVGYSRISMSKATLGRSIGASNRNTAAFASTSSKSRATSAALSSSFRRRPIILALVLLSLTIYTLGTSSANYSPRGIIFKSSPTNRYQSEDGPEIGDYSPPSLSELRKLVGKNPTFLAKDSHSSFGYNNIRYIFEGTLLLARIMNRIPILPESIWCRKCAVASEICTEYSLRHISDRNSHMEELGVKWNEPGEAWKLGIEDFLDIPHLRRTYGPVLLLSEFLKLYSLPLESIEGSGHFNATTNVPSSLKLSILSNEEFEQPPYIRIDRFAPSWLSEGTKIDQGRGRLNRVNMTALLRETGEMVWKIEKMRSIVQRSTRGEWGEWEESELIGELEEIGVVALYTFSDLYVFLIPSFQNSAKIFLLPPPKMNSVTMSKALVTPSLEFSFLHTLRPLVPSLPEHSTSLLYIPGDLHDQRHPGALRFSTPQARDEFVEMVTEGIRPPRKIRELGRELVRKMDGLVEGRKWGGVHIRRGDFLGIGWSV